MEVERNPEAGSVAAKQTIKGGLILDYTRAGPESQSLRTMLITNRPVQRVLNSIFKSHADTSKFFAAASTVAEGGGLSPEGVKLMKDSLSRNIAIVSGAMGYRLLGEYLDMAADFKHGGWGSLPWRRADQYSTAEKA